jgi:hypothetical protein
LEETCAAGCVADQSPHCAYLEPRYAPDVCDTPAPNESLNITGNGSFDPNLDLNCTGGVIEQPGTTALCVVHYGSISLEAGAVLTISGKPNKQGRVIMFIADHDLSIEGTLDVSAHAATNGPGGGVVISGTATSAANGEGGGGAGGATTGGDGGNLTAAGGANNGGLLAQNPAALQALVGGGAGFQAFDVNTNLDFGGGGGGGGVSLASCRGKVSVSGVISANGGGGLAGSGTFLVNGLGGGAGGNVVLQGLEVEVTGEIFANGGAGGGGRRASQVSGVPGDDGPSDTMPARAGVQQDGEGIGGNGGFVGGRPTDGKQPTKANAGAGGGGGSTGFLQTYTPAGISPTLKPTKVSPAFQSNGVVGTR